MHYWLNTYNDYTQSFNDIDDTFYNDDLYFKVYIHYKTQTQRQLITNHKKIVGIYSLVQHTNDINARSTSETITETNPVIKTHIQYVKNTVTTHLEYIKNYIKQIHYPIPRPNIHYIPPSPLTYEQSTNNNNPPNNNNNPPNQYQPYPQTQLTSLSIELHKHNNSIVYTHVIDIQEIEQNTTYHNSHLLSFYNNTFVSIPHIICTFR